MTITKQDPAVAERAAAVADLARLQGQHERQGVANAEAKQAAEARMVKARATYNAEAAEAGQLQIRLVAESMTLEAEIARIEAGLRAGADPRISALRAQAIDLWERGRTRLRPEDALPMMEPWRAVTQALADMELQAEVPEERLAALTAEVAQFGQMVADNAGYRWR